MLTLRSFLTTNAIRSTHAVTGVDWCSSNNSTPCALGEIGVPILVAAMGGNTGLRDNEMLYEMAASRDKDFIVVEGANHNIQPCTECETRKDQYRQRAAQLFQLRGPLDQLEVLAQTRFRQAACPRTREPRTREPATPRFSIILRWPTSFSSCL